jgi:hypothetical protein
VALLEVEPGGVQFRASLCIEVVGEFLERRARRGQQVPDRFARLAFLDPDLGDEAELECTLEQLAGVSLLASGRGSWPGCSRRGEADDDLVELVTRLTAAENEKTRRSGAF